MLGTALFRTGQWMAAHEADTRGQMSFHAADDGGFGAAGIGQESSRGAAGGVGEDLFGDALDRRAEDHHLRLSDGAGRLQEALVDRSEGQGAVEAGPAPAGPEHARRQAALFGGQANRAADQADTDDGEGVDSHREDYNKTDGSPPMDCHPGGSG